ARALQIPRILDISSRRRITSIARGQCWILTAERGAPTSGAGMITSVDGDMMPHDRARWPVVVRARRLADPTRADRSSHILHLRTVDFSREVIHASTHQGPAHTDHGRPAGRPGLRRVALLQHGRSRWPDGHGD